MILKHVYLYLNLLEYADDLSTPFGFKTRYVCNFLERRLRHVRFHTEGFSKICVQGRENPSDGCPIVSINAAVPEVHFDQPLYESLSDGDLHEFFIDMLVRGLRKCGDSHEIPLDVLLSGIEEFRSGGYRNEWVYKTKLFRAQHIRATLACKLTISEFTLNLSVSRSDRVLFDQTILRTLPDEIIFEHQFRDMSVTGDELIVTGKFGHTLYTLPLSELDCGTPDRDASE